MTQTNQKGMTLIELLVVIVILGILAGIAVIGFSTVIQQAKDRAFVANAYMLKEAAEKYYLSSGLFTKNEEETVVTFQELASNGFIELFKDPDTKILMPETGYGSLVKIVKEESGLQYYVCYIGEERNLCKDGGMRLEDITTEEIE